MMSVANKPRGSKGHWHLALVERNSNRILLLFTYYRVQFGATGARGEGAPMKTATAPLMAAWLLKKHDKESNQLTEDRSDL